MNDAIETRVSEEQPPESRGQMVRREIVELFKMVALFLALFIVLKTFVIEGYQVQGDSMLPTLCEEERVLVFKLPHVLSRLPLLQDFCGLNQGDIVVFNSGEPARKRYIKRLIARGAVNPGASKRVNAGGHEIKKTSSRQVKVEYDKGRVYVDNHLVDESYLSPEERFAPRREQPVYLEAGEYYVLGDHRSVSKDSRSFGPVDDEQIIGEAILRIWPLNRIGLL